jgi:hypothetical protein
MNTIYLPAPGLPRGYTGLIFALCPHGDCLMRHLIDEDQINTVIVCLRCNRTFTAEPRTVKTAFPKPVRSKNGHQPNPTPTMQTPAPTPPAPATQPGIEEAVPPPVPKPAEPPMEAPAIPPPPQPKPKPEKPVKAPALKVLTLKAAAVFAVIILLIGFLLGWAAAPNTPKDSGGDTATKVAELQQKLGTAQASQKVAEQEVIVAGTAQKVAEGKIDVAEGKVAVAEAKVAIAEAAQKATEAQAAEAVSRLEKISPLDERSMEALRGIIEITPDKTLYLGPAQ